MIERHPPAARIVDRGYQHYQGTRLGAGHSVWAMLRGAMGRGLGLRRRFRAKVLPWLLIVVTFLPVLVVLALQGISRSTAPALPSYARLYTNYTLLFFLFAGLVGPDLLCPDRRERVLTLYLAAPITRLHYVGARLCSLAVLLCLLTVAPMLVLFAGSALLSDSAAGYAKDHLADLGHVLLGGGLLALYYAALSLAVASFTDRRAYAAGAFLGLLLVGAAAGGILSQSMHFSGHERYILLDLANLPAHAVEWLFDPSLTPDGANNRTAQAVARLNGWVYMGSSLGVIAAGTAVLCWRYLRLRD